MLPEFCILPVILPFLPLESFFRPTLSLPGNAGGDSLRLQIHFPSEQICHLIRGVFFQHLIGLSLKSDPSDIHHGKLPGKCLKLGQFINHSCGITLGEMDRFGPHHGNRFCIDTLGKDIPKITQCLFLCIFLKFLPAPDQVREFPGGGHGLSEKLLSSGSFSS